MWQGKRKAVTFSYDDGITQDRKLIRLFDRYGLKATFNLNSGTLGQADRLIRQGHTIAFVHPRPLEIAEQYRGHEVACHTCTHANLPELSESEAIRQVESDRIALEELVGYPIVGMAYPCGEYNEGTIDLLKKNTRILYARTTISTYGFALPKEPLEWCPTVHHTEWDKMEMLANDFLTSESSEPQLFYIWGHSFEFEIDDSWGQMERFCEKIAGHDDIFYGTNAEINLLKR